MSFPDKAPVDKIKSSEKSMSLVFGYASVLALDQDNFFWEFTGYGYEGIVYVCGKGKSKYKIKRKREERHWR